MSSLELTHGDLATRVGYDRGYGRKAYADYSTAQRGVIDQALDSGYREFLYPDPIRGRSRHRWSFLWPEATLTLSEPQTSSTITVASGVVTIAAGTWPSWAAAGDLTPTDDSTYMVDTRDSGTQLTLDDTTVDVDAGTGYSLGRVEYDLPADFGGLQSDMTYRPGASTAYEPIEFTSWNLIRRERQLHTGTTRRPSRACLMPQTPDPTAAPVHKIIFNYQSDSDYILFYRYKVNVLALDATNKHPIGGINHSETLLAACLYAGERLVGGDPQRIALAKQYFQERLSASIDEDGDAFVPETLGKMRDSSDDERPLPRHIDQGVPVQYEGVTYY